MTRYYTKDIVAELCRTADKLGLDESEVAADEIARLRSRITHLEEMFNGWRDEAIKATARIAKTEALLRRIGHPGKQIVYCRDGHEEAVLLIRDALGEKND